MGFRRGAVLSSGGRLGSGWLGRWGDRRTSNGDGTMREWTRELRLSVLDQSPVPAGFTAGGGFAELDCAGAAGG